MKNGGTTRSLAFDVLFDMTKQRIGDLRADAERGRTYRRSAIQPEASNLSTVIVPSRNGHVNLATARVARQRVDC